jgi:hypothetical protein
VTYAFGQLIIQLVSIYLMRTVKFAICSMESKDKSGGRLVL